MARLQFWYDPKQLPEDARCSKEALDSFFARDPNILWVHMAFADVANQLRDAGPAGYGYVRVEKIPSDHTLAGIQCYEIHHHTDDAPPKTIYSIYSKMY